MFGLSVDLAIFVKEASYDRPSLLTDSSPRTPRQEYSTRLLASCNMLTTKAVDDAMSDKISVSDDLTPKSRS